jgi:hypothetical protein
LRAWIKFFFWQFPLAVVLFALVVEIAAHFLTGVTPHRHNVDDLAYAVLHDQHPYKAVLLGDSITHNVAHKYRIGDVNEIADMTTHALAGLPSSLFLLKRYLESGHRPRHVVIAASRDVFTYPMDKSNFKYYVTSTFTLPYERNFLTKYYQGYVDYSWRPAALSITTSVGEPLFSLLRRPGDQIWIGPDHPAPNPVIERYPNESLDQAIFSDKLSKPEILTPEARQILLEMCELSKQYGFKLHIIWAPLEPSLRAAFEAQGKLKALDNSLLELFAGARVGVSIDDASVQRVYPNFDRGLIHLKGLGSEQRYALQLADYIHAFEAQSSSTSRMSAATTP